MTTLEHVLSCVHRLALRAFPSEARASYGAELTDVFDRNLAVRAREGGRWQAVRFASVASVDAVVAGLGERRRQRVRRAGGVVPAGVWQDLTHACRALAKARGFTLICVTSLGLGLGVMFAMVVFVRSLTAPPPGLDTRRLVEVVVTPMGPITPQSGDWAIETWSYPDFVDIREAQTGMTLGAWVLADGLLRTTDLGPQPVTAMYASASYFTLVGVVPEHGRIFNPADDAGADGAPTLIISHRLWTETFGGDPDIVGRTVTLDRVGHVVVGVAPEGFGGHLHRREARPADVFVPLGRHPRLSETGDARTRREIDWLRVVGRLSPGASLANANGALHTVMADLAQRHPETNRYKAATVEPYSSTGVNQRTEMAVVSTAFLALSGMALIVVCLNVAGMMLVRGATRERELAVRLAIGATRSRLIRYLMSEAVALALAGGALSVAVVYSGFATLAWWVEFPLPDAWRLTPSRVGVCLALSLAATLVFGLAPSLRFSRPKIMRAIKDDAGGGGWRVGRLQRAAVAVQAGLALPFLVMGGLLANGAWRTASTPLGFEPAGLYATSMNLAAAGHEGDAAAAFLRGVQNDLRQVDGVTSVTVADGLPLDYAYRTTRVSRVGEVADVRAQATRVGDGYLTTLGGRLLRGRDIRAEDQAGGDMVAVISTSLASALFPDGDAIGRRVSSALQGQTPREFTVVGVAADAVTGQLQNPQSQIFVPLAQHPSSRVHLVARASADDQSVRGAFERVLGERDPELARPTVLTGATLVEGNIQDLLVQATIAIVVAVVALMLSALGIYGVVGYMVATRTREIGVRMALGASRPRVVAGVLADAVKLAAPGVVGGLLLAAFVVRQTGGMWLEWYDMSAAEPVSYVLAAVATFVVPLVSGLPPASRAASVDPIDAIRAN